MTTPDPKALYQTLILQHNRAPENCEALDPCDAHARGKNPMCGDDYTLFIRFDGDERLERVTFQGQGCAISKASASLLTTHATSLTEREMRALLASFEAMILDLPEFDLSSIPHHLQAFEPIRTLPVRAKCALLPWYALRAALDGHSSATTEGVADPLRTGHAHHEDR